MNIADPDPGIVCSGSGYSCGLGLKAGLDILAGWVLSPGGSRP